MAEDAAWSYNQTCLQTGVVGNSASDSDIPLPGQLFFYLVTRANACGESSLGSQSSGAERPNTAACVFGGG
jgi:hypothetical protein